MFGLHSDVIVLYVHSIYSACPIVSFPTSHRKTKLHHEKKMSSGWNINAKFNDHNIFCGSILKHLRRTSMMIMEHFLLLQLFVALIHIRSSMNKLFSSSFTAVHFARCAIKENFECLAVLGSVFRSEHVYFWLDECLIILTASFMSFIHPSHKCCRYQHIFGACK